MLGWVCKNRYRGCNLDLKKTLRKKQQKERNVEKRLKIKKLKKNVSLLWQSWQRGRPTFKRSRV